MSTNFMSFWIISIQFNMIKEENKLTKDVGIEFCNELSHLLSANKILLT